MAEDLTGTSVLSYFPTYDGNGNITAWVNASGTVVARQRYDAFGNIIQQTGTAPSNYGFSTKPIEKVTGLLYYGYRYYDPITGRWPSRDPIGERGGLNLYGFVGNNGVALIDYLGYLNRIPNPIPENPLPLKPVPVQPAPNPPQPAPNLPQPAPEAVFGIIYQSYTICMEVELIPCKGCDHIFLMPGTMICGFGESFSKPMKIDPLLMGQAIADWIMDEKALQVAREKALDDLFQSPRLKKPGCLQIKQDGEMIQIKNKPNAIWLPPIAPANW
jgi:RHS repeat-associated protein